MAKLSRALRTFAEEAQKTDSYWVEKAKLDFALGLELQRKSAGMTYKAILYLCLGKMSIKQMTGPVGIVAVAGDAAKLGWQYLIQLMAHLSISLAVINLLPIPALDGGHLFFLLVEGVRRKKVSLNFQDKASQVGFALLLVLMVFVVYNDLVNLQVFSRIGKFFGMS